MLEYLTHMREKHFQRMKESHSQFFTPEQVRVAYVTPLELCYYNNCKCVLVFSSSSTHNGENSSRS